MQIGLKKKIKVFFPITNSQQWMGGYNYYKNLFHAFSLVNKGDIELFLPSDNPKDFFKYASKISKYHLFLWNNLFFYSKKNIQKIINKNIDIFSHCGQIQNYPRSIYWIPDFQHIHLPEMFSPEDIKKRDTHFYNMAKNATLLLLSSNDAFNDFKKLFPEYVHKVRILSFVSYIDPKIYDENLPVEVKSRANFPKKYFYVPNQFWKHKNHIIVFKAIAELKRKGIEVKVVFSGLMSDYRDKDYIQKLNDFISENKLENNIYLLGLIDLNEVYYLMRHAVSVINPSLFEGWSTTVEEVKSLGKNIILSNINVHKEQNPIEGIYFNPYDEKELAEIMHSKWLQSDGGPDYSLEEEARKNMLPRMCEFGNNYKKILYECFEFEKNKI